MNVPNKLKIMGHDYSVRIEKDMGDWHGKAGVTWVDQNEIRLDSKIPKSRMDETLLHEIMHAVFHGISMDQHEGIREREEYIVDGLSKGLYQVLKDNKLRFE